MVKLQTFSQTIRERTNCLGFQGHNNFMTQISQSEIIFILIQPHLSDINQVIASTTAETCSN